MTSSLKRTPSSGVPIGVWTGPWRDFIDNPMNEHRWGDARAIADRLGWPRRGMANRLEALERLGLVESKRDGQRASMWSDAPPRVWRLK